MTAVTSESGVAKGTATLRLALPKGRMQEGVAELLAAAGIRIHSGPRAYRPRLSLPGFEAKILKPHNIVEMLHHGSRDIGFAGADWVKELGADIVELLDTGLDPVRVVAAAPSTFLIDGKLPGGPMRIASEYPKLTQEWVERRGIEAEHVHSSGATEVFPPEDADCIVDNTATGSTLRANDLEIVDELMTSSTRIYASRRAYENPASRARIDTFVLLVRSVLEARTRVLIEVNVPADKLSDLVDVLPSMRRATVAPLHDDGAFAVKAAVLREQLPVLIPLLKERGGTDILVMPPSQIVP